MHNEFKKIEIKCSACGSSCKTPDVDIFEYVTIEKVNKESKHYCLECSKKIDSFIESISLPTEFNL